MKRTIGALLAVNTIAIATSAAPVSFTGAYEQNFDTLALSSAGSDVPDGWHFVESGTGADTTYGISTGSSTGGNTYSFGSTQSPDRAFGGLQSGSVNPTIGAQFENAMAATIASISINYTGEQWRLGKAGRQDRLDFQYSLDATSLTTGTWTDFDAGDFASPSTATTGALDGNAPANRLGVSFTITGLAVMPGGTLWLRWTDFNADGADDGLAIDDFLMTAPIAHNSSVPDALPVAYAATVWFGVILSHRRLLGRGARIPAR